MNGGSVRSALLLYLPALFWNVSPLRTALRHVLSASPEQFLVSPLSTLAAGRYSDSKAADQD